MRSGERRKEKEEKCVGEEGRGHECRSMEGGSSSMQSNCMAHIKSHA